jgi:hypothetical protein
VFFAIGHAAAGHADVVRTHRFDLASAEPLPRGHDVHLYADVLYAGELAEHVARRCAEALAGEEPPRRLLVTADPRVRCVPSVAGGLALQVQQNHTQKEKTEVSPSALWHPTSSFFGGGIVARWRIAPSRAGSHHPNRRKQQLFECMYDVDHVRVAWTT